MSWENRVQGDLSSSQSSRPSNTLARLAFNIYGNSGSSASTGSLPSRTPGYTPSRHSPPNASTQFAPIYEAGAKPSTVTSVRLKTGFELISLCKLNNEQDSVVVAGKNALQVLRVGTDVTISDDLLTGNYAMKNKKLIGSILDVKAGFQTYSKLVATSTTTGSIIIFNTASQKKLLYKFTDHTRAVNSISFSHLDPHSLLSGSQDGAMKLWDLRASTGKAVLTMHASSDAVRSLQFSPFHNKKLAAIFDSGVIQKWDVRVPGQYEKKFNAHTGPGLSLDWHTELDYIVSGGRDKQVQVWNMNSQDTRLPEHVIYCANPVSRVSFKPGPLSSIKDAEVATSFLNNDVTVQVFSLRRPYIPIYTLESHNAQVTGLLFRDERTLWTCSKDKYFVKEDLNNHPHTIDNLHLASVTWAPNNDLMFIDQVKRPADFELREMPDLHQHHQSIPSNTGTSTSPNSPALVHSPSVQSYSDLQSPRPGISRAGSFRPPLTRNHSHNSKYHQHSIASTPVMNPQAVPVKLPIMKSDDALKFLTENYIFDNTLDLVESCERNAHVATQVGNNRDSQTWNVIKESLLWEKQLQLEGTFQEDVPEVIPVVVDNDSMRSNSASDKYHYSTSNSTNFGGKSPSLSDLSELNSSLNSRDAGSFPERHHRTSQMKHRFSGIDESGEEDDGSTGGSATVRREDVVKWADALRPRAQSKDNEEAIEFEEAVPKPINLQRKRSNRNSLLEAILHPEISPGGKSASPTYSISSSLSAVSHIRPYTQSLVPLMHKQQLSKLESHTSELTKQLTRNTIEEQESQELLPPFAPRMMIYKAVEFSAGQGDLVMSCTLLLLFNEKYKIYKDQMMKAYLYQYLEFLQRMRFWTTFTKIIGSSKFEDLQAMSLNSTSIRRFCAKCGTLVVNEMAKEKFLKDEAVEYGTWFCESCGERSKCVYCNEPIKGLNIFKLRCGHSGHFGCFKTWVMDERMDCCPGGC